MDKFYLYITNGPFGPHFFVFPAKKTALEKEFHKRPDFREMQDFIFFYQLFGNTVTFHLVSD